MMKLKVNSTFGVVTLLILFYLLIGIHSSCQDEGKSSVDSKLEEEASSLVESNIGIDTLTGLALDPHFELVRAKCISCHSAKLITQNRATREGWKGMLDWMYETQNLQDLGEDEEPILDYLAKHYAPVNKGRRANLEDVEWYVLESE